MPITRILVALALDADSERTAERAIQLAIQHRAQLIGVHVVENLPLQDPALSDFVDAGSLAARIEDEARHHLQSLLETAEKPAIHHVGHGRPHDVIGSMAASCKADLIIIGPGEARTLREKVFGSTADRLVRLAPCPIIVVRKNALAAYRRIAVGVDFSDHANEAARWASRLSPDASLQFVHALEIPLAFEQSMLRSATPRVAIDSYRQAKARLARQKIMAVFGKNGRLPKAARVVITRGDAAGALVSASRRRTTELVAIGTRGANAVAQHLLGSVARKVLAGAKCDVLVVPNASVR